jgi:hypothetical protein
MKNAILLSALLLSVCFLASSCQDFEDEGPMQYDERSYEIESFTGIDARDALTIEVKQGAYFDIEARGDRRNLNDLIIRKSGNTLLLYFAEWENRQHETYVTIILPTLTTVSFSGATNAAIKGFDSENSFSLSLSGASIASVHTQAQDMMLDLSGASVLQISGSTQEYNARVTGASSLKAFGLTSTTAKLSVSGASSARVTVSEQLQAIVNGSSSVVYRGNPQIESEVKDSSSLIKD